MSTTRSHHSKHPTRQQHQLPSSTTPSGPVCTPNSQTRFHAANAHHIGQRSCVCVSVSCAMRYCAIVLLCYVLVCHALAVAVVAVNFLREPVACMRACSDRGPPLGPAPTGRPHETRTRRALPPRPEDRIPSRIPHGVSRTSTGTRAPGG